MAFNPRRSSSSKRLGTWLRLGMAALAATFWAVPAQAVQLTEAETKFVDGVTAAFELQLCRGNSRWLNKEFGRMVHRLAKQFGAGSSFGVYASDGTEEGRTLLGNVMMALVRYTGEADPFTNDKTISYRNEVTATVMVRLYSGDMGPDRKPTAQTCEALTAWATELGLNPGKADAPPAKVPVMKTEQQEKEDIGKVVVDEKGIGRVTVDGVKMSFAMGEAYDPKDEYPDDEPNFTSVRKITVHDDRGTFLAAVEALEKWCRSETYPMNVDMDKFKKLKADWLKKPATAANYKKASKEFKSIRFRPIEDQAADDFEWQSVCGEVNPYAMELKIFQHLPDGDWSKYETKAPAWMSDEVAGAYPYIDQVKFVAYKFDRPIFFCSSVPKMNKDKWRLVRDSRLDFTINRANAEQTKDINHYAALMDEAKQRIEWKQERDGDLTRLARVCREYEALVSKVNGQ